MIPKFRVWDKWRKVMYPVMCLDWRIAGPFDVALDNIWPVRPCGDGIGINIPVQDGILMPFIGLCDKAGREIYRDDIVRYLHPAIGEYLVGVVTFEDGTFTVGRMWDDGTHEWTSIEVLAKAAIWEDGKLVIPIEVIGNIWENPDLLDGEARE